MKSQPLTDLAFNPLNDILHADEITCLVTASTSTGAATVVGRINDGDIDGNGLAFNLASPFLSAPLSHTEDSGNVFVLARRLRLWMIIRFLSELSAGFPKSRTNHHGRANLCRCLVIQYIRLQV